MNENDQLAIVLETILDDEKSLANLTSQLDQLLKKLKNYRIAVSAGLDTAETKAQLKSDLDKLDVGNLSVSAHLDKTDAKNRIAADLKTIGAQQIDVMPSLNMEALRKQLNDVHLNIGTSSATERLNQIGAALDGVNHRSVATIAGLTLLHRSITMLERAARNIVRTAAELDKQLTDLRMVTGESYAEVSRLVDGYNRLAREVGATTQQVLDASTAWLRQGKSVAETQELIRQSMVLSKVGAMDSATATQRLTSAMKGYGLEVGAVSGVVDKLTALDMAAAVSADGLAESLSHTASSANLAGVSLDRVLAYITVVGETTQKSASVVGESFKSLFARIQKVTNGEALDDYGQDISQVESTLRSLGIELRKSETEFRDIGDVLDEIGKKFNSLDSVVQRQIVTAMGGVYQSENLLALLKNYDKVADYIEISANSAGTAAEKFAAYQESVEAHTNALTASAEALAKQTLPAELINGFLDAGTAVLDFANAVNLLQVALSGLGTALALKGLVALGGNIKDAYTNVTRLSQAFTALDAAAGVDLHAEEFTALIAATKGLDAAQLKLILSSKTLTTEQRMAILTANGMTEQEAAQTLATLGLASAEGTAAGATLSLSGAFHALTAAMAANPIGMIAIAVSAVVGLVSAIDRAKQKAEEVRREILDTADAAAGASDKIGSLTTSYLELAETVKNNSDATDNYLAAKNDLLDALSLEQSALDKLIEQYGTLDDAIRQASIVKLKEQALDLAAGVTAARDALLDAGKSDWTGANINAVDIAWNHNNDTADHAALGAIKRAGVNYDLSNINRLSLIGEGYDLATTEGVIKSYERLRDVLSAVREAAGADNDVFKALYTNYKKLDEVVDQYQDTLANANRNLIQTQMLESLQGETVPQTQEAFEAYRQSVIDAVSAGGNFVGSAEQIAATVDDVLSRETSFAEFYRTTAAEAQNASENVANLNKKLEKLETLQKKVASLSSAYADMSGKGAVSFAALSGIAEQFGDLENIDDYISRIAALRGDTEALSGVMNELVGEYIDQKVAAGDLTDADEEVIEAMLREKGVANADEAAHQLLTDAKIKLKGQAIIAKDGLDSFIDGLKDETSYSASARASLIKLAAQMVKTNETGMDFFTQIQKLRELGRQAGITGALLALPIGFENDRQAMHGFSHPGDMAAYINRYVEKINSAASNIKFDFDWSGASGKSSKSGSGGGTGGAKRETDKYIAEIDRFREAVKRLEDTQSEAARLEAAIDNSGDLMERSELRKKLAESYTEEQEALHSLNEERRKAISEGVDKLTKLGFEVDYDPETNDLFIKNLEHLNELSTTDLTKYETMADMSVNVVGTYKDAQEATNGLIKDTEGIIDTITKLNESNQGSSESWLDREKDKVEAVIAAFEDLQSYYSNKLTLTENWLDKAVDERDYASVRDYVDDTISYYQKMQENIHAQAEYYRSKGYTDTSDEVSRLSDLWWDYEKEIENAARTAWEKVVENAHEALDEIQNVYDAMHSAADEYAANGGFLSIDTVQSLLDLGTEYMQYLYDENGMLKINEENIRKVIAAKMEQLALEQALSYVERLRLALDQGEEKELERLLFATTQATSATWDLVYANLAMLKLNDEQYEAAKHNIDAIRSLARSATQSIGDMGKSVTETLNEMKSGLDDILKYVMDMLKQRVQDQIAALNDMKNVYSEIIDLKKKSLSADKEAASYQKTIAAKLKEMAQLQAKIDALSLDDSRESQAERSKLLEELADLQEELSDTQSDHMVDAQQEALDKMEDDYHKEKDQEIDVLEETISSYQKLYDMAIEYISSHWDTLYNELIDWNTEYGSVLNSEITSAWENCLAAAQRYGDYVSAMTHIDADRESAGTSGVDLTVGQSRQSGQVPQTQQASAKTPTVELVNEDGHARAGLSEGDYVVTAGGIYRITAAHGGQNYESERVSDAWTGMSREDTIAAYERFKKSIEAHHDGGFAGGRAMDPKQDEVFALLQRGELVLTKDMVEKLGEQIERMQTLQKAFVASRAIFNSPNMSELNKLYGAGTVSNVSSSAQNVINIGDTNIYGTNQETVKQHEEITRKMANQIFGYLHIKR